ncbi:MAG: ferritin-like domain-containing protein [Pseudomonadota bacterium]
MSDLASDSQAASPAAAQALSRRGFFNASSKLALSASALALLGGKEVMAAGAGGDARRDTAILNVALALEHEAINAYTLGAQSGLLQKPVLAVAVLFQSHHKAHRDALIATIEKLGAKPVAEKTLNEYAEALHANKIANQADILMLAQRLELGASNAYLSVIPALQDKELAKIAARLAADETMHWTALSQALGASLPGSALSFGA